MACRINNLEHLNLGRPCTPQMGGLKFVYVVELPENGILYRNVSDGDGIDLSLATDEANNHGTYFGIHVTLSEEQKNTASAALSALIDAGLNAGDLQRPIYRIDVTRQGAVMTSEAQVNKENGSTYYKNSATIPTAGLTQDVLELLDGLKGANQLVVIGETYDGRFYGFGFYDRATLESASVTTGANFGDHPGATFVLSSEEAQPFVPGIAMTPDDHVGVTERPDKDTAALFRYLSLIP